MTQRTYRVQCGFLHQNDALGGHVREATASEWWLGSELEAAVSLVRTLVAFGNQPLPGILVQRAAAFLEKYPYQG